MTLVGTVGLTAGLDRVQAQERSVTNLSSAIPRRCLFSSQTNDTGVEPGAGSWKTWVLSEPGRNLIGAPPFAPDDIAELFRLAQARDASVKDRVLYWNEGGPSFRWNEIAHAEIARAATNNNRGVRLLALLNVAIYDSIVAAWDAKYLHKRPRPSECNPGLTTLIDTPASPSYPSAYAAAAGAASSVLAYIYPERAQEMTRLAEEAALSRLQAGVNYRSDVDAGLAMGRAVGALVVNRARNDGSSAVFTGTIPTGACNWKGTNPNEPLAGTWRTWVLTTPNEVRPAPPPSCDSAAFMTQLAEVKNFPRPIPATAATYPRTRAAFFWQTPLTSKLWHDILTPKIFEYGLDDNPPRAARAFALFYIAGYDSMVAAWDAKFTYWFIRPSQFDPSIVTLFPVPNHPSYPSAHAIFDGSYGEVLSYLFPRDEAYFHALSLEAGESRIWAGIHYRFDAEAGLTLSREVGKKVIERAKSDGSQ